MEDENQAPIKRPRPFRVWMRKFWYDVMAFTQLKEDTDYDATVKHISSSVEFRGVNLW